MQSPYRLSTLTLLSVAVLTMATAPAQAIESRVGRLIAAFDSAPIQDRSAAASARAAADFLEALDPVDRRDATMPLTSGEWRAWSNLPPNPDYAGVCIKDLSPEQMNKAFALLATSLSPQGFEKIKGIMLGDDLLVRPGRTGNMLFGADFYWLIVFGEPSTEKPWGWQFDGHHLGLNVVLSGDNMTIAPSFVGTQPAQFTWGESQKLSFSPMREEVAKAFALVQSLDEHQRAEAVIGPRRQNLDAGPGDDSVVPPPAGVPGKDLRPDQRAMLVTLIGEWVHLLPERVAAPKLAAISQQAASIRFAWAGETETGSPVYFRIHGPSVLIEFANQNLGGDPLQHLHSIYREPGNDYAGVLAKP